MCGYFGFILQPYKNDSSKRYDQFVLDIFGKSKNQGNIGPLNNITKMSLEYNKRQEYPGHAEWKHPHLVP